MADPVPDSTKIGKSKVVVKVKSVENFFGENLPFLEIEFNDKNHRQLIVDLLNTDETEDLKLDNGEEASPSPLPSPSSLPLPPLLPPLSPSPPPTKRKRKTREKKPTNDPIKTKRNKRYPNKAPPPKEIVAKEKQIEVAPHVVNRKEPTPTSERSADLIRLQLDHPYTLGPHLNVSPPRKLRKRKDTKEGNRQLCKYIRDHLRAQEECDETTEEVIEEPVNFEALNNRLRYINQTPHLRRIAPKPTTFFKEISDYRSDSVIVKKIKLSPIKLKRVRKCQVDAAIKPTTYTTCHTQTETAAERRMCEAACQTTRCPAGALVQQSNEIIEIADDEQELQAQWKRVFFNDLRICLIADEFGNFPIHQAVIGDDVIRLKRQCMALAVRGLSLDIENYSGLSALHLAITHNANVHIVKTLIEKGANPMHCRNETNGGSWLHLLTEHSNAQVLDYMLKLQMSKGKELDVHNYDGYTALIITVLERKVEMMKLLLENGANPNVKDLKSGRTPLFHAVESNNVEYVEVLLRRNANTQLQNYNEESPADIILEQNCVDPRICTLIEEKYYEENNISRNNAKKRG